MSVKNIEVQLYNDNCLNKMKDLVEQSIDISVNRIKELNNKNLNLFVDKNKNLLYNE